MGEHPVCLVAQKVAQEILEFRVERLFSGSERLPVIFWLLCVVGFFLTLVLFGYLRSGTENPAKTFPGQRVTTPSRKAA